MAVGMWSEPDRGEHAEDGISSVYMSVLGFPKGTSTPRETANVFGCVIHLSDLDVFHFTGPKLETVSKLVMASKCPHHICPFSVQKSDGNSSVRKIFTTCQVRLCSLSFTII